MRMRMSGAAHSSRSSAIRAWGATSALRGCFVLLGGMLGVPTLLLGQSEPGTLPVQQLEPAPGSSLEGLSLHTPATPGHWVPTGALYLNYARRPLTMSTLDGSAYVELIGHQLQADLIGALGLSDVASVAVSLPLALLQRPGAAQGLSAPEYAPMALGDLRVSGKVRAFEADVGPSLALEAQFRFPTGNTDAYQGAGGVAFEPRAILEWRQDERFRLGANLAWLIKPYTSTYSLIVGQELLFGLGLRYALLPNVAFFGEIFGRLPVAAAQEVTFQHNPLEVLTAVRMPVPFLDQLPQQPTHLLELGVGAGLFKGYGTPEWRALVGYRFEPVAFRRSVRVLDSDHDGLPDATDGCPFIPEDSDGFQDTDGCLEADNDLDGLADGFDDCPLEREDADTYADEDGCPDPDNDADRILDAQDHCPDEAETYNQLLDDDGCPEQDRDGDGIFDYADRCPTAPERFDGIADADGCPEDDTDGDGILDAQDQCPQQPELKNGLEDTDGCPEPDADGDRIADALDRCPTLREVYNSHQDTDGCPDTGVPSSQAFLMCFYETDRSGVTDACVQTLAPIARYAISTPQVRIRVTGHTDDVGTPEDNLELSRARAETVASWLEQAGVSASRLTVSWSGRLRPRASNANEPGRAANRRTELELLGPSGTAIQHLPEWVTRSAPAEGSSSSGHGSTGH